MISEKTLMSKKNIAFIIVAEQGYIRNIDAKTDFSAQNDILFSAISDTYIPLLDLFGVLESENVPFKVGMVLSAPLCSLLDDPQIQQQYISWLERRIALGRTEVERCKKDPALEALAAQWLKKAEKDKIDFTEVYAQNLLEKFRYYAEKEYLELIPTAATYAFLPHYNDMTEVLNAQVETGLYAHRHFFGDAGEGFWLPYMGWTKGIDKVLRAYGVNYTVVDSQSFLFSESAPEAGIFAPARCANSLALFACDNETPEDLSGPDGYCHQSVYRSQQRDAGFDLDMSDLGAFLGKSKIRVQTGYKYFANRSDGGDEAYYDSGAALEQVRNDALAFYTKKVDRLSKAAEQLGEKDATLVCTIPAELLGQTWYEGITWFEQVLRLIASKKEISMSFCRNLLEDQFSLPKIEPYPCAASGTGYGEDLLDSSNGWMMRYIRKASERMIDLTERFPSDTGLKARLLNLGAKELLLAQSGDWPKMIHEGRIPDYVTDFFKKNILSFTAVFDSLGSNTVSTEWLTEIEKEHALFPWMNYRVFSRKK